MCPPTRDQQHSFSGFIEDCKHPLAAQDRVWKETRNLIASAPYWTQKFPSGVPKHLRDFGISYFKDYEGAFESALKSGVSPLNQEKVDYFAETSGTSGPPKRLPITATFMEQRRRTQSVFDQRWQTQFSNYDPDRTLILAGRGYSLSPTGVRIGFLSNYQVNDILPTVIPKEIFNSEEVYAAWMTLYSIAADPMSVQAITPSKIASFLTSIKSKLESSLPWLTGEKPTPVFLPRLAVSADRLKAMEKALGRDEIHLRDIWPNLLFVTCFTTGPCELQMDILRTAIGNEPIVIGDLGYLSTEGRMGAPIEPAMEGQGSVLHPGAHVVEFLEEGAPFTPANMIPLVDLKVGGFYEIFLTTAMGYVRFHMEDILECTGKFYDSPVVRFVRKSGAQFQVGIIRVTEATLVNVLKEVSIESRGEWCFGPSDDGTRAVIYHNENDLTDENVRLVEQKLREIDASFNRGVKYKMERQFLPKSHSLWRRRDHAQTKLKLIVKSAPGET